MPFPGLTERGYQHRAQACSLLHISKCFSSVTSNTTNNKCISPFKRPSIYYWLKYRLKILLLPCTGEWFEASFTVQGLALKGEQGLHQGLPPTLSKRSHRDSLYKQICFIGMLVKTSLETSIHQHVLNSLLTVKYPEHVLKCFVESEWASSDA